MAKVNFDHIDSCPIDSDIIDDSEVSMHKYFSNPNSFHELGRAAKAQIEESRNFFAESLNVQANELFFLNDTISQTKILIDYCILILDINHIFISAFEDVSILNYLKLLEQNRKIKLNFVPENSIGEINIDKLKELFNNTTSTLLTLSHANEYTGFLLPVKNILELCLNNKVLFHLNLKSTIGKYKIDIQKIKADFITFDFTGQYGPKNIGIFFLNQSAHIPDNNFHTLKKVLKDSEKVDNSTISAISKAFFNSLNNLQEYQKQIKELREYLISEFNRNFKLKNLLTSYHKDGLYTVLIFFIPSKQFGNYIAEKLDINGIVLGHINKPLNNHTEKGEYIRFSFGKKNSTSDIDYLVRKLKELYR